MAEIIVLHPARDELDDRLFAQLDERLASLIAAAVVEDDAFRMDLLLAGMQAVACVLGLPRARILLLVTWSSYVEMIEDLIMTVAHALREAGVVDPLCEEADVSR